jgi:hypothetical protein
VFLPGLVARHSSPTPSPQALPKRQLKAVPAPAARSAVRQPCSAKPEASRTPPDRN